MTHFPSAESHDIVTTTTTTNDLNRDSSDDDGLDVAPLMRLPDDILRLILDQIEPDTDRTVPVDRRQFLSIESFDRTPLNSRGSVKDIGSLRCMCRRFADLGGPLLFSRVSVRFSDRGLDRLEELANWPHVARHVKKFSYLVPCFLKSHAGGAADAEAQGSAVNLSTRAPISIHGNTYSLLSSLNLSASFNHLVRKAKEQRQIINTGRDLQVLKKGIASFVSLQLVQLLRVTDQEEARFLGHLRSNERLRQALEFEWAPACLHSSRTIGEALLTSDAPWSRFSSPMLSPQSAEFLALIQPDSLSTLSARLTCLTLHFDDGSDLDQKIASLSPLFKTVFATASNMQAVHLGFPSHRPLALPLESVFHDVRWDKLVAFGIQGWKLDAAEVIGIAMRHKERLKGLRLRDVLLKEGSTWKDVLTVLRNSLRRLEWISLRRIGYARLFDELLQGAGVEVTDDAVGAESDSEDGNDDTINSDDTGSEADVALVEDRSRSGPFGNDTINDRLRDLEADNQNFDADSSDDVVSRYAISDTISESDFGADSEHGPDAHEMDFPPLNSPGTPASTPWCSCSAIGDRDVCDSADELNDDGKEISNLKRKAWERWVVRKCHDRCER